MADITNLSEFLSDVANAIRTKKETTEQIPAENFDQEILSIDTIKGQEKTIIPSTAEQIITPDGDYNAITKATIKAVDSTIDSNISPENIKKNINILGVTGTLEEGEQINNQDKEITTNGTYTADEGYTGLGTVTVNVPQEGGSGDIKLFETKEAMQADPDAKEGDLAVVYREEIQEFKEDTVTQFVIFPETVVLDEAYTESSSVRFRQATDDGLFNGFCDLSQTGFNFNAYGDGIDVNVQYTSTDGITYTRSVISPETNSVDFGTQVQVYPDSVFVPQIGKFMLSDIHIFEGLFEYVSREDFSYFNAGSNLVLNEENTTGKFATYNKVLVSPIQECVKKYMEDNNYDSWYMFIVKESDTVYSSYITGVSSGKWVYPCRLAKYQDKLYIVSQNADTKDTVTKVTFDITNGTYSTSTVNSFGKIGALNNWNYFSNDVSNNEFIATQYERAEGFVFNDDAITVYYEKSSNTGGWQGVNIPMEYAITDRYCLADTQFTLNSGDDVLYNAISYGKNGIVKGTLPLYMKAIQPSKEQITLDDGIYKNCYISAVTKSIDENIQPYNIASGVSILNVNGTLERVTENYINDNATSKIFTSANFSSVIDSDQYVSPVVLDTKGNILGLMYTSSYTNCYLCAYDSSNNTFPNRTYFSYSQIDSTYGRLQDLNNVRFSHIDEFGKGYMYWINGYHINRVDVLYDYALKKFTFDYTSKKHYDYSTFYTGTNQISSTFIYDFKINPKNINQILCRLCVRYKRSSSQSASEMYFCTFECTDDTDMKLLSKVSFGDVSDNSNKNGGNVLNILNDSKLAMYSPNNYAAGAWASVGPTIFIVLDDNFNILKVTNTNGKVQSINKEHTKMLMSTSLSYSTNKVYNVYDISIDYTNGNITFTKTNKTVSNGIHTNACISYDGEYLIDYYMIDGTNTRKNIAVYKIDFNTDTIYTKLLELTPPTTSTSSYGAYSLDYLGECTSTNIFFGSSYTCYVQILLLTKILDSITYKNKTFTSAPITQNEYDQALTTSEDILGITQDNQVGG